MKKLLILVLLAPLFIGAAPPEPGQNTIEFWGGTGRYRRQSGCNPVQRVEYHSAAVNFKHRIAKEQKYLNDSGMAAVKKVATPFSLLFDISWINGTATDILDEYDYDSTSSTAVKNVQFNQTGFKLQGDWRVIGAGLGITGMDDDGDQIALPSGYLRIGQRDKVFLTGEYLYASPLHSGHGAMTAGLGHQSNDLDLWAGLGYGLYDESLRPGLTVKYHFDNMLLGVDASYGTSSHDGVRPYSVSVGVGYEF